MNPPRPVAGAAPARSTCARAVLLALAALAAQAAVAQEVARISGISTTLDTALTLTDTQRPGPAGGADLITEVRPGLRYFSRSGRVRGAANYSLGLLHRTRGANALELQHLLSAALTAEAIERRAFIDVNASVSKQSLSAFGQQSVDRNRGGNSNLSEVASVSASPYVRGALGTVANYDLRLNAAVTRANGSITGDSTTTGGSLTLNSAAQRALIGWGLNASSTSTDFRGQGKSNNDRLIGNLNIVPANDLTLTLRGGREATNIGTVSRQTFSNWGGQLRWLPTERTVADFSADRRFFGTSHAVTLSHRFPQSSFRFTSLRDVNLGSNANNFGQPQTNFQLFFAQFASVEPDPVLRDLLVRNFLAGQGLDPNATTGGGFVDSGATVQQRQDLGWSYTARRTALAAQAFINRSRRIEDTAAVPGANDVHQWGYNATLSYRLTPTAALAVNGSRLVTKPTPTQAGSNLKSLLLSWTDKLGPRTSAGLSARYSVFNSATSPYREAALNATLGMQF